MVLARSLMSSKVVGCLPASCALVKIIENLEGGDFVFVVLDEFLERLDNSLALSSASALKAASMTLSWLTLSMVCSSLLFARSGEFRRLGHRRGFTASVSKAWLAASF